MLFKLERAVDRLQGQMHRLHTTGGVRGRLKQLPPPDVRFQQKLSKVAEALKSGRSSQKWRILQEKKREKKLQRMNKKVPKKIQTKKFGQKNPDSTFLSGPIEADA